jgi:hypothetical protein
MGGGTVFDRSASATSASTSATAASACDEMGGEDLWVNEKRKGAKVTVFQSPLLLQWFSVRR